MLDVIVYISSVANPKKHPRKTACLENFAQGVKKAGYKTGLERAHIYHPSKLAVILGWATTNTGGQNITLRKQIIQEQKARGLHTMCIDASCWKYLDNAGTYLRYSLGGPFYDTSEYANANSGPEKWQEISKALGIKLLPTNINANGHILICMQRDGGFSMKNLSPMDWLYNKIQEIRAVTDRKIVIRPHPGAYNPADFPPLTTREFKLEHRVLVLNPLTSKLIDDLTNAHAAVFFNSSASVAAVCQGVPIFVDDVSCVAWDVANKDIRKIETPEIFAREQWLYNLAAAHWSDDDARTGRIYQKFLPYLTTP